MKRNILARRAASAALAACMMFSLSAPALAESTDALLQQSTAAKSAVSVLDEENGTEEATEYQMILKYGSISVYIGADDKQNVQPDVHCRADENDNERRHAVAECSKNTRKHIVKHRRENTDENNADVQERVVKNIGRRTHQCHERARENET